MLTPLLSEKDEAISSEGSLDPLGLYQIADALAVRLVPGVRERQIHPRFLTAIAVSLGVCSEFEEEAVAKDGISPPWQVFEWYLVEGFVRTVEDTKKLDGVPGRLKAGDAVRDGVPLSAKRYLKTPTVFGYHGVYRTLSENIGVEAAGRLGEAGYQLLTSWADEQGLRGFCGTSDGPGRELRAKLKDAVKDGLAAGAVARGGGWSGWSFFAEHLLPGEVGRNERKVIRDLLVNSAGGFRRQVFEYLVSEKGSSLWKAQNEDALLGERVFHERLVEHADPGVSDLLRAIMAYETFARALQDAFEDCLLEMSRSRKKTPTAAFAAKASVRKAVEAVPELFEKLTALLSPYGQSVPFQQRFASLAERSGAKEWVERLIEHHQKIQRQKPPNGKAPWFVRADNGDCVILPAYVRSKGARGDKAYVHAYRTVPLWSFAEDLRMV